LAGWVCRRWLVCASLALVAGVPRAGLAQRERFPTMVAQESPYVGVPASPYTGAPATTAPFGTTAQPPGGFWDPYADPLGQPTTSLPPVMEPAPGTATLTPQPGAPAQPQRFFHEIGLKADWLSGSGSQELGVTDIATWATTSWPFWNNHPPLLITPGFAFHFWQGPVSQGPGSADMPPQTYDAYLDVGWKPVISSCFSADLGARVGVYSDFDYVTTDSIRIMGRALGIYTCSPQWKIVGGAVYLDRIPIKLLPAGGVIWTPNPDMRFEIIFPTPKLALRCRTLGTNELWIYARGDYGGGAWTITRADGSGDEVGYNDIRVLLGLDLESMYGWKGFFEAGYVFNRELDYTSETPTYFPSDTAIVSAGFTF
jgi:hypothetical protein